MKTIRAEFRNHQLWNLDAPLENPERLVFKNGSEVVITLRSADDLYKQDPGNEPYEIPENLRLADAKRRLQFAAQATVAEETDNKFFESRCIMKRGELLYFTISAGIKHTGGRKEHFDSYFEVELLEDLYLVRKTKTGKGEVAPCHCIVRAETGNNLRFFEPVHAYSLNDAYSKTYVLYFSIFGKGTTNVYTHFSLEPRRGKGYLLETLRKFESTENEQAK